jgi:hypothetical protein
MFQLIPLVGSRLAPWLGRTAAKNPGFIASLVAKLRAGGGMVGDKISDIVKYFMSSPMSAALTLTSIAGLGISTSDLFKGVDENDEDIRSFMDGLTKTTLAAREAAGKAASAMVLDIGSDSEDLDVDIAEKEVDLIMVREILSWAKSHFGSPQAAMKSHRMMQAFVELPYEDVVSGYAHLRI